MTVGERLKQLSGLSNATVGAMLLAIGTGATVGAILVNYSGLATGTVAEHLLVDHAVAPPAAPPTGGGSSSTGYALNIHNAPPVDYLAMARYEDTILIELIVTATSSGLLT